MEETEVVMFPVERRWLSLVTKAVADAYMSEQDVGEALPSVEWSGEDLSRLDAILPDVHIARAILDLGSISDYTGVALLFEDIVSEDRELKSDTARAQLSGLSRRVKSEFKRSNWPFLFEWTSDGRAGYTVEPSVAEAWRALKKVRDKGEEKAKA